MTEYVDRSKITYENLDVILGYENHFEKEMGGVRGPILYDSPELLFLHYLSCGEKEKALNLFEEYKLVGNEKSAIDAPMGRYEGLADIEYFFDSWLGFVLAERAWISPVLQTRSGNRSATEMVLNFKIKDRDKILRFPAFVIGDIRPGGKLDELRIYFFCKWMPGIPPYRPRQWKPQYDDIADHNQLTGMVREYFDSLHDPTLPFDRFEKVFNEDIHGAGYGAAGVDGMPKEIAEKLSSLSGKDRFTYPFKVSMGTMPFWNLLRIVHSIDDGRTCVCEWISIPGDPEYAKAYGFDKPCPWDERSWQSGCSAYERGPDGKLIRISICDYYGSEYGQELEDIQKRF